MRWNKNIPSFEVASSLEKVVDKHRHRQISPFPHDSYVLLSQIIELMPEIVISADLANVEPGVGHATLAPSFEVAPHERKTKKSPPQERKEPPAGEREARRRRRGFQGGGAPLVHCLMTFNHLP